MAFFLLVQCVFEGLEVRRLESFCKALAPGVVAFVKANTVFDNFKNFHFAVPARKLPGQAGVPSQLAAKLDAIALVFFSNGVRDARGSALAAGQAVFRIDLCQKTISIYRAANL
jgi:hypothetical protein